MKPNENAGNGAYERSSVCADNVKTMRALKRYLCSLAVAPNGKVNVEQCRRCYSQCAYGKKYVKMSDEETEVAIEMPRVKRTEATDEKEAMSKLRKELAEERKKRKELESEVMQAKDDLQEVRMLCDDLETANQKYKHEINGNDEMMKRMRAELEKAKKEGRTAEERLLEMDVEADRLRGEIRQLAEMNSTLADVEAGLEAEVLKLRKKLEEEKAERAGMEMRMMRLKSMVFDAEHPEVA